MFLASPAFARANAENSPAYLIEHEASAAALEAGDRESAIQHARAAWRDAENALGDDRLTALYAYDYAKLVLSSDAKAAAEALRRADELRALAGDDISALDLNLFLAYAEFEAGGQTRRDADRLRKALAAIDAAGLEPTKDVAGIWFRLALSDIKMERYTDAAESSAKAETAVAAAFPGDDRLLGRTIMLRGIAALVPLPRRRLDVDRAMDHFMRAWALFPPQKDLDSFDPAFAQLLAWMVAADAAYHSFGKPSRKHDEYEEAMAKKYYFAKSFSNYQCGIEWEKRDPPEYPDKALEKRYIGGAIVGFNISSDGRVQDERILAEVPKSVFGDVILKSMSDWRLKSPTPQWPECRLNRISQFTFVIND